MRLRLVLACALVAVAFFGVSSGEGGASPHRSSRGRKGGDRGCRRGRPCWPTQNEIDALFEALEPNSTRLLIQDYEVGVILPTIAPPLVPLPNLSDEENSQPLYGLGRTQIQPLYQDPDQQKTCMELGVYESDFCKAIVMNSYLDVDPDFVVFPLTVAHVQAALDFAIEHRLRVTVSGAGHELNGRNQNARRGGSILIRTILMQEMSVDLGDLQGLGDSSATFGAGVIFDSAQNFAMTHNKMISTGNCNTVGLVGWSISGGHGPFAPKFGLGVDNLLAVDIVLANGDFVRAEATGEYTDLFKALRGGAGSTWGIITSVVIRLHDVPEGGFTLFAAPSVSGATNTDEGLESLENHIEPLVDEWKNSQADETVTVQVNIDQASHTWTLSRTAVAFGAPSSARATALRSRLASGLGMAEEALFPIPFAHGWTFLTEIIPPGSSVVDPLLIRPYSEAFVQRDQADLLPAAVVNRTLACPDGEFCISLVAPLTTGNIGSPQPADVSISGAMRTAMLSYLTIDWRDWPYFLETFGSVYLNEVGPDFDNPDVYGPVFWGDNYEDLKATKRKYDPTGVFSCRQCVA